MNVIERAQAPTPSFFKRLRNIGLALVAISAAIITSPVAIPAVIVTVAGYVAVAGTVIGAVSQMTTKDESAATAKEKGG